MAFVCLCVFVRVIVCLCCLWMGRPPFTPALPPILSTLRSCSGLFEPTRFLSYPIITSPSFSRKALASSLPCLLFLPVDIRSFASPFPGGIVMAGFVRYSTAWMPFVLRVVSGDLLGSFFPRPRRLESKHVALCVLARVCVKVGTCSPLPFLVHSLPFHSLHYAHSHTIASPNATPTFA